MDLLTRAIIFATKKHEGQTRKGKDTPYIVHPLEALSIASTVTDNEAVLSAAVLHDVVEDCFVSLNEVKRRFGEEVMLLVAADTENKRSNIPSKDSWTIRKQETLDDITKMDKNCKIVVLSDKLSNMRAITRDYRKMGDNLWQVFNCKDKDKQAWYYKRIAELLKDDLGYTDAYTEYCELLKIVF